MHGLLNTRKTAKALVCVLVFQLVLCTFGNPVSAAVRYSVKPGDSLYIISSKYGVSISSIRRLNNKWDDLLNVGQLLMIPSRPVNGQTYYVELGDTLFLIAERVGISLAELRNANGIWNDLIRVGQALYIPNRTQGGGEVSWTYTVKSGDTLYLIAKRFGTTVATLKSINALSSDMLRIGQKLQIPGDLGSSKADISIVVDPGHGGSATGAAVYTNTGLLKESELNLDIGMRLTSLLRSDGYKVVATRDRDIDLPLWKRVEIANANSADLFVSVHADDNRNYPQTRGSNVYIQDNADLYTCQLANSVQKSLELGTERPTNALGRVIRKNYAVVMQSRPAILVEVGFLSNQSDRERLQTTEFRQTIADSIWRGINEWVSLL